jgi:hypothetical protein
VFTANAYAQTQTAITEEKVLAVLKSLDKATRAKNLAGMLAPIASDVKIKNTYILQAKQIEVTRNRAQYESDVKSFVQEQYTYDCVRKSIQVKILDDGQSAIVTDDNQETRTLYGRGVRWVASEVLIFYVREGQIVMTSKEGTIRSIENTKAPSRVASSKRYVQSTSRSAH